MLGRECIMMLNRIPDGCGGRRELMMRLARVERVGRVEAIVCRCCGGIVFAATRLAVCEARIDR